MRSKVLLIMALIMGLATTFLFYRYMSQFGGKPAAAVKQEETIVAKQDIARYQVITADMLEKVTVPDSAPVDSGLANSAEIVGKVALYPIARGETIPAARLTSAPQEDSDVALKVRDGYRAVAIGVNMVQSVSNLIEPGDLVDVIYSKQDQGSKTYTSQLLLEQVRVLAVGRRMVQTDKNHPYQEYSTVTLELNSGDAVKAVNAAANGTLTLDIYSKVGQQPAAAETALGPAGSAKQTTLNRTASSGKGAAANGQ